MSYSRDPDAHTRGPGAIAAYDGNPRRRARAALATRASKRRDLQKVGLMHSGPTSFNQAIAMGAVMRGTQGTGQTGTGAGSNSPIFGVRTNVHGGPGMPSTGVMIPPVAMPPAPITGPKMAQIIPGIATVSSTAVVAPNPNGLPWGTGVSGGSGGAQVDCQAGYVYDTTLKKCMAAAAGDGGSTTTTGSGGGGVITGGGTDPGNTGIVPPGLIPPPADGGPLPDDTGLDPGATAGGFNTTTLLVLAAAGVGAYLLFRKKKGA